VKSLALLATLALIGAGCGNAPAETATTQPSKAVRFAQCMRDHGVKGFPDPDADGTLTIDDVLNGSSLDPDAPAWKRATSACQDLQPAGFTGHKRDAAQQDAALVFAQCMRDHGVEDFPDPLKDGPMVDTNRIPSTAQGGGMEVLNAAMQACGDYAAKALEER
jgi:hypothetical protein